MHCFSWGKGGGGGGRGGGPIMLLRWPCPYADVNCKGKYLDAIFYLPHIYTHPCYCPDDPD